MSSCNHDCSSCSEKCSERNQNFKIEANPNSDVKKVIGVVSGKGGVGKSLVTSMLAVMLNKKGYKTAIIDGDITGSSIAKVFDVTGEIVGIAPNTMLPLQSKTGIKIMSVNFFLENPSDPVVWRGPVLAGVLKQFWTDVAWQEVDYMFVDMPPGTGDIPLTAFQSYPLDGIVVVTTPQDLVSEIVTKAMKMAKMMNIEVLGMVLNNAYYECDECHKKHYIYGQVNEEELMKKFDIDCLSSLPIDPIFARLSDNGKIEQLDKEYLQEIINKIINN